MTYCPPNPPQEYEFTALTGTDILAAGDTNLNCGDVFEMPVSATACITVTDNDGQLSGDACNNEWGDDTSWQIADIKIDGVLVEDGVKIYAEEYYVLHGDDGACYYLIEIETAGNGCADDTGDYYAFYGNVPPAGTELTVAGKCNVTGNWLDYRCMSAGLKWDLDDDGKLLIEAEDMALKGYRVDDVMAASGGEVIKLKNAEGEASITFGAESGTYDLELAYIDENDGEGAIEIWVNDTLVHTIELDQNNNGNGGDWSSISKVTVEGLQINSGDEITLRGTRDCWEFARIDALTFCAVGNAPPVAVNDAVATDEDTLVTLDLLANDSDPDLDTLTVVSADGVPAGTPIAIDAGQGRTGTVTVTAAGLMTFTPDAGFNAMAEGEVVSFDFEYVISDGNGETSTATTTVTVNGLNDGPDAVDDAYTVSESALSTLDILLNDSDPEDDDLTVTLLSQPIEGSVTLDAAGNAIFDPGTDFEALTDGMTATVTFDYQISDGQFTDTATVTVTVLGEGVCVPTTVETTALTTQLTQPFTVTLETPDFTKDGFADYRFAIELGDTATERYNFVFIVDVSGTVGVADSFEPGVSVLDAQIAALQQLTAEIAALGLPEDSVTVSLVPFATSVALVDLNPSDDDFNHVQTFGDNETFAASDVQEAIGLLSGGGFTNYFAALAIGNSIIQQQELLNGEANDIVYFLSDGDPNPAPSDQVAAIQISAFASFMQAEGAVHAIGLGDELTDTFFLDLIDDTGGAELVTSTSALESAIGAAPVEDSLILGATLNIYRDGAAAPTDSFDFVASDFEATPIGYDLSVASLGGLGVLVTESNTAELVVDLDEDGDLIADDQVILSVDIETLLPASTDL